MSTKTITVDALLRDIRAHCVDCMGGQRGMVAHCTSTKCRLWPWRLPPDEAGRDYLIDGSAEPLRRFAPPPLEGEACVGRQISMMDKEAEACAP